jgi:hypothetical protein
MVLLRYPTQASEEAFEPQTNRQLPYGSVQWAAGFLYPLVFLGWWQMRAYVEAAALVIPI